MGTSSSSTPTPTTRDLTQTDRFLQITTPITDTTLVLESFSGTEALSTPFEFHLTLLSSNPSIDFTQLLNNSVTVNMTLADGTQRPFNGIINSVRQKESTSEDLFLYEATLVPKLWLLSLTEDIKIFQNQTVPQIVSSILSGASISAQMPDSWPSQRTPPTREYCVQYRETSLNFISRLLEEEGIFYYFDHTSSAHTMMFSDKSETLNSCPNQATVSFSYSDQGWREDDDGVKTLERVQQLQTGKVTLQDYNFTTPSANLQAAGPGSTTLGASAVGEFYDFPGEYDTVSDGTSYATLRIEELETNAFVIRGESRCRGFQTGYKFTLQNHFRSDTNGDYVLLSVTHDAVDSTYRTSSQSATSYSNIYVAIPKSTSYRPPRVTPKPIVKGLQTALVVGKAGEEIWVDQYGRVKVQFYWDRVGPKNENSSCWVRVSQIWAGKNWGWITIPRIGQEVIVDFLEGDPDRPIITGRVYNADQMPPFTLPDNQTQSGIQSRSSKSGTSDNFNEIRFEDKKGSEEVYIQAEKDMNTLIKNNDGQTVDCNRTITVKGTHTETITKDTTITIDQGNHSLTLNQGNQSVELKQGNRTVTLDLGNENVTLKTGNQTVELNTGNQSTKVDLGAISMQAMQSITLTVGPSSLQITPTGITLSSPMITITGDAMVDVESDGMLNLQGSITMVNSG